MNANPNICQHPHAAGIPDPQRTEGVRAYREPAEPHPLQLVFLDPAGERAWIDETATLLASGRADDAEARLAAELAGFDGALARLCKSIRAGDVVLEGWEDLLPILGEWEGPPVTAITIGLTNPADLVFESGPDPEPELLIGLYSDDGFSFSRATKAELLAECSKDLPAWVGGEEDVEFYCTISGLAPLNAALINCKHRHFLRDGRDGVEGRAPGGYVEYVLGCWWLATRFLQALTRAVSDHGAPAGCRLIAGTVELNADFVTVLGKERSAAPAPTVEPKPEASLASLTVKPYVPREDPLAEGPAAGSVLRQRLRVVEPEAAAEPRARFLARLFVRFRRR